MTYGTYLVIHIDVLGQGEALLKLEPARQDRENFDAVVAVLRETAGRVKTVRDWFTAFFEGISTNRTPLDQMPPQVREQYVQFRSMKFGMQKFSDSIVIFVPLFPHQDLGFAKAAEGLWAALMSTANLMLMAFAAGIPLRGGIDVGPGLDIDENEIYGAVLVHAHRLESKHAEYPRALIGEGLLRYLSALETSEDPGAWKGHSAERASACHKIITRAPDDHLPMLHILAPEVLALGPHHHELPPKALQWAARERVSHAESNNTILMQRYDRLLKYFAACGYSLPAAVRQTT